MGRIYKIAWLVCVCLFVASNGWAAKAVQVEGNGATKEAALKDGLRTAVEQVLGVYLVSKTQVKDAVAAHDEITTKTAGFVKTFQVVSCTTQKSTYTCMLKVVLEPDKNKILTLLRELLGQRTLAVDVKQFFGDKQMAGQTVSQAIIKRLIAKKRYVVKRSFGPAYHITGYVRGKIAKSQLSDDDFKAVNLDDLAISIQDNHQMQMFMLTFEDVKRCIGSGMTENEAARDFFTCLAPDIGEKMGQKVEETIK